MTFEAKECPLCKGKKTFWAGFIGARRVKRTCTNCGGEGTVMISVEEQRKPKHGLVIPSIAVPKDLR